MTPSTAKLLSRCFRFRGTLRAGRRTRDIARGARGGAVSFGLLVLLAAGPQSISAAGPADGHLINVWTAEDGLRSSSVTAVAQTLDGHLWVGTYNGLARFDGVNFTVFDPATTPELRHARVRHLHVDAEGTLWVSLHDGSLSAWRQGRFTLEWEGTGLADSAPVVIPGRGSPPKFLLRNGRLLLPRNGASGAGWTAVAPPGATAGSIALKDWDGVVWLRTRDHKLWRLTGGQFDAMPVNLAGNAVINGLTLDRLGRVWLSADGGLWMWNGTAMEDHTPTNGGPVGRVQRLLFLRNGDKWVLADDRLRRARNREWLAEAADARGPYENWFGRLDLHEDARGNVWLSHYGRGLAKIAPDGATRWYSETEPFPGRRVDCLYEDREGNLWAGVDRGGLVRLRERQFFVIDPGSRVGGRTAAAVTEDHAGRLWLGTYGAGLHQWDGQAWRRFFAPDEEERGFVFSVAVDAAGRVWASAGEEELFVLRDGRFERFSPAVRGVKALLGARDGILWVGCKTGLGYLDNGVFRLFSPANGVPRVEIRALAEDRDGTIWAGGGDGIIYRVRNRQGEALTPPGASSAQPVWSLLADEDGTLWAGTFRGGLLRYAGGAFTRITTAHGLPDDVISQLLDDGSGNLWIGSQRGIFRVAKAELHALAAGAQRTVTSAAFGRYDGLPSLESSSGYQPASWRARDGRLLFSTLKGLVAVRPESVALQPPPPPVVIETLVVDGRAYPIAGAASYWLGDGEPPRLVIPPGRRQLEFYYAGVSLLSPDRVRFRHRLAGLEREWTEAGPQRTALYSLLRPGDYTFEVIAGNGDGVWTPRPARVAVRLLPHFYETRWFLALAVLGVVGSVAAGVRHRYIRRMRLEIERVERQRAVERDRTRIARDIHDDLGAGLTHIALLSEMTRPSAPPEVRSQLAQITEVARELAGNMDEIVWAVSPENDTLDGLVTYISKFTQDYLRAAGLRSRLAVPARAPAVHLGAETRHNLFLAVREALHNVVQHAQATEVELRLETRTNDFQIILEDNGRGLAAPAATEPRHGRIATGHGLANLHQRLELAGGRCMVVERPGGGTRVEMTVPMPRSTRNGSAQ